MVIERKSVVTPASYIHQHQLEHEFADRIWAETRGKFEDDGYVLTAGMRAIRRLSSARMRATARAIGKRTASLSIGELPFRSNEPIAWSFRRLLPGEEEVPRRGIVVNHVRSMSFDDSDREEALAELPSRMQDQIDAAAAKFDRYHEPTRVVLLDFYSEELWEEDVTPAFGTIRIPPVVDEVWRTIRDWVSADDYRVGYERLFRRY
jgi:hypothetical protein